MTDPSPRARLATVALIACWPAGPALGQGSTRPVRPPDPGSFARELRRVHVDMARGRFQACRSQLDRLLERHRQQRYVFEQKAILLEDYRRCAFHLAHAAPSPQQALSGELVHHDRTRDTVTIRYRRQQLADFNEPEPAADTHRNLRWHPAVWRPPYSIEIRGNRYRETVHPIDRIREVRLGTSVHIGGNDTGHLEIAIGNQRGTYGERPAQVVSWRGARQVELQRKPSPARLGDDFVVRIDVLRRGTRVSYQGRTLFQHPDSPAGRFAIEGLGFETVSVTGAVDPGWLRGRIDHRRQQQLDAFDRSYDASEVPQWLFEGGIAERRSFNPAQAWPAATEDRHHPILRDLVGFFEANDYEAGLGYLEELGRDVLPPSTRSYLFARFYNALDEIERALAHCERLVEQDPEFVTGRQLRAELWVRRGQGEQAAVDEYRRMIAAHPHARELYVDLAVLLIQCGRASAAESVLAEAIRKTGNQQELMTLQRMLISVTRGPAWERTFEHRSRHYIVRSNIDAAICKTAAQILEQAHDRYERALGRPRRRAQEPYRVFLFAGRTGYERFCSDILGERDTHTAGLYSATLKQLLIWNLPDQAAMLRTIRHEGFHQYLDSLVHDAPAWLNEGLAEYFEATARPTDPTGAGPRADHLRTLEGQPWMPTGRFVRMPWLVFYRGSDRNYAQAWALVHFLRHGPERWRGVLPALLAGLAGGRSPKAAVAAAFRNVDSVALDRDLAAYLRSLQRR